MASEFLRNLNHIVGRSLETEFGANTIVLSRRLPRTSQKVVSSHACGERKVFPPTVTRQALLLGSHLPKRHTL